VPWNVLHPREAAFLRGLAPADLAPAFTRLWTLKEAYAKALGTGFSRDPASFCVLLEDAGTATVLDRGAAASGVQASTIWVVRDAVKAAFGCVVLRDASSG
jgi:phosphopantetheinyl transferase